MYNYHNKGSYGERKVDKILTDTHIKFYREFEYGGMIGPSGYPMRFDFIFLIKELRLKSMVLNIIWLLAEILSRLIINLNVIS